MRVIAGVARGRKLAAPQHGNTRPTPDRVREALFSALAPRLIDARVLDLFAGSGALGIEALSRGARAATFVEHDKATAALLRRNLTVLPEALQQHARLLVNDATRAIDRLTQEKEPFDLVFVDPPYAADAYGAVLQAVASPNLLAPQGTVVLEHPRTRTPPAPAAGLVLARSRAYGSVCITSYNWAEATRLASVDENAGGSA